MKFRVRIISLALVLLSLMVTYNGCGAKNYFLNQGTTTVGNPMTENLSSYKILVSICTTLTGCNSSLSQSDCQKGVLNASGIAEAVGAPAGVYATYSDMLLAEAANSMSSNSMAADNCVADIASLTCGSSQVAGAYNPSLQNPYLGVPAMLSQSTGSCISTFHPTWTFVDRKSFGGINVNPTVSAFTSSSAVFNAKLYATWVENGVVRIAVYNGSDPSPAWTATDGGGLNFDKIKLAAFPTLQVWNSKLYAAWIEKDPSGLNQVRVSAYNGNDTSPVWALSDGAATEGINPGFSADLTYPVLAVFNNQLYITWVDNQMGVGQARVAVFDGTSMWKNVSGSSNALNKSSALAALQPTLAVLQSKLYATWAEANTGTLQIRVAVYNGNDVTPSWILVDGAANNGLNANPGISAEYPRLVAFNSKLYIGWDELAPPYTTHFKVYNGSDSAPQWTSIDTAPGGGNFDLAKNAQFVDMTVHNGRLFASWVEQDSSSIAQVRVALYNGNDAAPKWDFVDGNATEGINFDQSKPAVFPHLTSFGTRMYAIWPESDAGATQIRAAFSSF